MMKNLKENQSVHGFFTLTIKEIITLRLKGEIKTFIFEESLVVKNNNPHKGITASFTKKAMEEISPYAMQDLHSNRNFKFLWTGHVHKNKGFISIIIDKVTEATKVTIEKLELKVPDKKDILNKSSIYITYPEIGWKYKIGTLDDPMLKGKDTILVSPEDSKYAYIKKSIVPYIKEKIKELFNKNISQKMDYSPLQKAMDYRANAIKKFKKEVDVFDEDEEDIAIDVILSDGETEKRIQFNLISFNNEEIEMARQVIKKFGASPKKLDIFINEQVKGVKYVKKI